MTHEREFRAIDPLALVLSNAAYVRLTLPDPNPEEIKAQVRTLVQRLGPEERRAWAENIRTLDTITNAFQAELGRGGVEAERAQVRAR